MAIARLAAFCVLYSSIRLIPSSFGVILRTTDKLVWANEFESIELTCLIESISTNNPRIEWKKIKNGVPSYVYFQNRISGDLEDRAQLREPANIVIFNATRADTAEYRCEVAAIDDQRDFDEILISLAVRVKPVVPRCSVPVAVTVGTSPELRCLENEGFPASQYSWFHNKEELPQDPKTSPKYINSSYTINADTGSLKFRRVRKEDAGEYYCQAKNDAGYAHCPPQLMEVLAAVAQFESVVRHVKITTAEVPLNKALNHYHEMFYELSPDTLDDIDILGILLKAFAALVALICILVGVCHAHRHGCFSSKDHTENNYKLPAQDDGVEYGGPDEGHFRHKSSFVI